MTPLADVRAQSPPLGGGARGLIRWVCTSNPFYVLSAGLFLAGLRISIGTQTREVDTWALMSGLAGYTLLLAVTACLLVRFGNVWDDVRTVLLLVVLMFLATSVTFDEVLVLDPDRGFIFYLGGLGLAVLVSEGVLRGIRLALPAGFRVPYYLILGLFFLYPLALSPLVHEPRSETLLWGLFGFSSVASLVFLTLLPAIQRGPDYIRDNGSPWPWPLYPWTLFGLLGLAVPARAFLLCWSMHLLGNGDSNRLIFGLYFLVPFGLAVAVLLLEIGLVARHRGVLGVALAAPLGLIYLALVGHRDDPVYEEFRQMFTARLGGDPLYLTLLFAIGFYAYAALRRVPLATEALTAFVSALAVVGPHTLDQGELVPFRPAPILLAAGLQLGLGLAYRVSWRCLPSAGALVAIAVWAFPEEGGPATLRSLIAFHLALAAMLIVGAAFDNFLAHFLRAVGAALVLAACLAALSGPFDRPSSLPPWAIWVYPLGMAAFLAGYGLLLGYRPALAIAGAVLICWLATAAWRGYCALRLIIVGLDYLAMSLALFALAVLISLGKSGVLSRRIEAPGSEEPPPTG